MVVIMSAHFKLRIEKRLEQLLVQALIMIGGIALFEFQGGYTKAAVKQADKHRGVRKSCKRSRIGDVFSFLQKLSCHGKSPCFEILVRGYAKVSTEETEHGALADKELIA